VFKNLYKETMTYYNMETHQLHHWSLYLPVEDYIFLIEYVENIKYNIPNHRMIILSGAERTGKTTLKNDIANYLGHDLCGECLMSGEIIYNENIKKMGFFTGIDEISRSRKTIQAIINFIKYKQSFIADTNHIERVHYKLLQHSKIIMLNHVF